MKKHNIRIFSTRTCLYCNLEKDFLKEHNIKFEDIDVSADRKVANEMIKKSGQMSVPVTEIDGEIIIGFDKEKLKKILGIKE